MADMISIIKRAAMDAVAAQKPAALVFGTVEGENPLEIRVEQKLVLRPAQLVVPESLTDREIEIEMEITTDSGGDPGHDHNIRGRQVVKIFNGLKAGEHVLLLRMQGGQKYMILDRVVST